MQAQSEGRDTPPLAGATPGSRAAVARAPHQHPAGEAGVTTEAPQQEAAMSSGTLHARLLAATYTDSEERLARVILNDYPQSALGTAAVLAAAAGTSQATATRFAAKLGYASFRAFQEDVRDDLRSRLSSLGSRMRANGRNTGRSTWDILIDSVNTDVESLNRTLELLNRRAFEELAAALMAERGDVYVIGSKKARHIAANFAVQLQQLRPGVHPLALTDGLPDQILDVCADDLLVVYEPRRATKAMAKVVSWFGEVGATVAVICDEHPVPTLARNPIVLTVPTQGVSLFDSYSAILSVSNALLAAVAAGPRRSAVAERIDELESINTRFEMWADANAPQGGG